MIDVALRMLYGDRAKYTLLITGVCFSAVLIAQGLAMFFGILSFSYATVDNIRAPIWVVDPMVEQVADNQPLRDTDAERVRSVRGVAWAVPLYATQAQAKVVGTGETKPVTLIGLDPGTLAGAPRRVVAGALLDLRRAQTVVIDEEVAVRLGRDRAHPLRVGDVFEMNDRRAEVCAIVKAKQGLGGASFVFTTLDRAREYGPGHRRTTSHLLAAPEPGLTAAAVARAISRETGLKAVTEDEFREMSKQWMIQNSPIPFVVGLIVGVGVLVGVVVAGQTFYSFVLENTRYLGALKAMGASTWRLAWMTILQASVVGITGYGLGMGLLTLFFRAIPEGKAPLLLQWQVALFVFVAVFLIIAVASLLGIRRLAKIEAAIVFR